jgi:hypothetical protein
MAVDEHRRAHCAGAVVWIYLPGDKKKKIPGREMKNEE